MSDHLLTFVTSLIFAALLVLLAAAGWRARKRRQADVPAPSTFPDDPGSERFRAQGQYVTTTSAGDWLDRIAVHGLGIRTRADAVVCDAGVLFDRAGSGPLWVPAPDLVEVRLGSGMAGKFVERDGLVVLEWRLGERAVDTGFRTRRPEDKTALVAAIEDLMSAGRQDGSAPADQEEE
ncbi:PH-like domain-containing protein [Sinomonas sp.]|uniref:PH-like domain-containing protein n=1 Tax=Sinomonas sp. TaxID=1914986 RepID=UPI002FE280AA